MTPPFTTRTLSPKERARYAAWLRDYQGHLIILQPDGHPREDVVAICPTISPGVPDTITEALNKHASRSRKREALEHLATEIENRSDHIHPALENIGPSWASRLRRIASDL